VQAYLCALTTAATCGGSRSLPADPTSAHITGARESGGADRGFLSRGKLQLIRPHAVFALLSRAHVVRSDALAELLLEERFRAAVVDLFSEEPLPVKHPVCRAPRAIPSSHGAGVHPEAFRSIGRLAVRDVEAIVDGLTLQEMQSAQLEFIRVRG